MTKEERDSLIHLITSDVGQELDKQIREPISGMDALADCSLPPQKAEVCLQQMLSAENLYIAAELPREVAILHAYEHGPEHYRLWLSSSLIDAPLHTKPRVRPKLALSQWVKSAQRPRVGTLTQILDLYEGYCRPNLVELRKGLRELRKVLGSQLQLIVSDHTDFDIPWEFLKLSKTEYIGAAISTARWQHIASDEGDLVLEPISDVCVGRVLSFVSSDLKTAGSEREFLWRCLRSEALDDIDQLKRILREDAAGYSLIYMACEGFPIDEKEVIHLSHLALGSRDQKKRLSYLELNRLDLNLIKASRSIVFINACDSGGHRKDTQYYYDEYRRGFPELFLAKGARGVIGTIAAVADEYAAEIAQDLLSEIYESGHLPIAELLRRLRARAVVKFQENPTEGHTERFVYTFMYVYYGNPMARLTLNEL